MTAHERAEAFIKRYPTQTWTDKKFMVAALEIELTTHAMDEKRKEIKTHSQVRPFRTLPPRPIDVNAEYGLD